MRGLWLFSWFLATWIVCTPQTLFANGMRSHLFITEAALKELPDGKLRSLLNANKNIVLSGSYFPDSGYAAKDDYGEMAHWEPFLGAFLNFIKREFKGKPLDKADAAKYVSFLMGAASHSMADQCFDTLFMRRTKELDGDDKELDLAGDVFLVMKKKSIDPPEFWVPFDDAAKVFKELGHNVKADTLKRGMSLARTAQITLRLLAESDYERLKTKMPWAEKMLLDPKEPGALPYLGKVVAKYWQVLWRRLQDENAMDEALLISQPARNAANIEVDKGSVTSQLTFFFGYPLLKKSYTDANIWVEDVSLGNKVPINISWWGAQDGANTLKLRPKSNWSYDTEYKVTLSSKLVNLDKQTLPLSTFTFRTRPKVLPEPADETSGIEGDSKDGGSKNESISDISSPQTEKSITTEVTAETPASGSGCGCEQTTTTGFALWFFFALLGWLQVWRRKPSNKRSLC